MSRWLWKGTVIHSAISSPVAHKVTMVLPYNPLAQLAGLEFATVLAAKSLSGTNFAVEILTVGSSGTVEGATVTGCGGFASLALRVVTTRSHIVHFMEIWPNPRLRWLQLVVAFILKVRGVAVATTVATYGNISNRSGKPFETRLWGWLNDFIVGLNPDQNTELIDRSVPREKFRLCPRGVPVTFYPATSAMRMKAREKISVVQDEVIVLFMGRFVKRKRPVELALAWEDARNRTCRSRLLFVGSGAGNDDSVESELRAIVARNSDTMDIRPWTDNPLQYLHASDIFVLPSEREGQPNGLLQAMACGLPVVVCSTPGLSHVVKNGITGFTTVSPTSVLDVVHTLSANSNLRDTVGARASEFVGVSHNLTLVREFHIHLYTDML